MTALEIEIISDLKTCEDVENFIACHARAQAKSPGTLKNIYDGLVRATDFMIQAKNQDGTVCGQCLLFRGTSDESRFKDYPNGIKNDQTFIITSVSSLRSFSAMLQEIEALAYREGITHLALKTPLSNQKALDTYQDFEITARAVFPGESYESAILEKAVLSPVRHFPAAEHIVSAPDIAQSAAPA